MARMDKPDVVLLDITMPGRSGLEVTAEIKRAAPKAAILVLSMHDDSTYVREAFAQGATGYLLKEAADEELLTAVREVAAGHQCVHPMLGARLASAESPADIQAAKLAAAQSALRAGDKRCWATRCRPHQPGDREDAVHLGAHSRDAPGTHLAVAAPHDPRRTRPLRAPTRLTDRRRGSPRRALDFLSRRPSFGDGPATGPRHGRFTRAPSSGATLLVATRLATKNWPCELEPCLPRFLASCAAKRRRRQTSDPRPESWHTGPVPTFYAGLGFQTAPRRARA